MPLPLRAALAVPASLCSLLGCASPDAEGRGTRHFVPQVWGDAVVRNVTDPVQVVPEAAALVALPFLLAYDKDIQHEIVGDGPVSGGQPPPGTVLLATMGAACGVVGIAGLAAGDEGHLLEVGVEAALLTEAITFGIKSVVHRERPEPPGNESMPSDHAALAFAAATFLGRSLEQTGDEWYCKLGYAAYVPAGFVAYERVRYDRHYMSDVTAGALIGMFVTHVVFNAHIGGRGRDDATIFAPSEPGGPRASLEPFIGENGAGLAFSLRF